ncbi:hypothetical protein QM797_02420 [Rhodococcus sp. IEGM 1381]|nr:hypothetical protein [Rhodococcus sp. IEGM 1381]MDI9893569.1 hypothetical protein [Rhodococcus sp. IEGM 1381]
MTSNIANSQLFQYLSLRNLTDPEAHLLRDRAYRAVHIGPVTELTGE